MCGLNGARVNAVMASVTRQWYFADTYNETFRESEFLYIIIIIIIISFISGTWPIHIKHIIHTPNAHETHERLVTLSNL